MIECMSRRSHKQGFLRVLRVTLRAMRENARQGYWNGSRPPFGYQIVAAEQRGAKIKKKIEPNPMQVENVRLMFRLARIGDGENGPMGMRQIADHLNNGAPGLLCCRSSANWGCRRRCR
jgi:hypothetical protein